MQWEANISVLQLTLDKVHDQSTLQSPSSICFHFLLLLNECHWNSLCLGVKLTFQTDFSNWADTTVMSTSKWARGLSVSGSVRLVTCGDRSLTLRVDRAVTDAQLSAWLNLNVQNEPCASPYFSFFLNKCACVCIALCPYELDASPPARKRPCQLLLSPETEPWSWAARQGRQGRLQWATAQLQHKWHMWCDTPLIKWDFIF